MPDIHNTCLVVAIFSLLVSSVVIWLSLVAQEPDEAAVRHEREVLTLLRQLQTPFSALTSGNSTRTSSTSSPGIVWSNLDAMLGNYFTGGYFVDRDKYHKSYTHSPLVILPFFQDHHGHFENCLQQTALAKKQAVSPKMTVRNRFSWDTSNEGLFKFKRKFRVHYGEASFGLCGGEIRYTEDLTDKSLTGTRPDPDLTGEGRESDQSKCGHVFIMQDPISLAIDELGKCLLDPRSGSLCPMAHLNTTTVEGWVAARGNVVFKSLLYNSKICLNATLMTIYGNQQGSFSKKINSSIAASVQDLCDVRFETFTNNLTPEVVRQIVDFITTSIQNVFSVVGLYEDIRNSLTLINHVFRFPLQECEFLSNYESPQPETLLWNINKKQRAKTRVDFNKRKHFSESLRNKNVATFSQLKTEVMEDESFLLSEAFNRVQTKMKWEKDIRNETASLPDSEEDNFDNDFDDFFNSVNMDFNSTDQSNRELLDPSSSVDINESVEVKNDDFHVAQGGDIINHNVSFESRGTHIAMSETDENGDVINKTESVDDSLDDSTLNQISENEISLRVNKEKLETVKLKLYQKFTQNDKIREILWPDIQIYKAVLNLYAAQKQLFFNVLQAL